MWIHREIESVLQQSADQKPALILTGCRQSGKTSLLQHVFPNHSYLSLDLPLLAEQAEDSGMQFMEDHPPPLIIDEIQYAPRLFRFLKAHIDRQRKRKGLYLITGSQKFPLMQGVTESLAGRIAVMECHTLSGLEVEHFQKIKLEGDTLLKHIVRGGYPELLVENLLPSRFYADYLSTYLERDVRSVIQVRSLRDFDRFMRLLALRTGQLLSMNSLAADLGLSPKTIRSWLSVLEASNIIYFLEPYYRNPGKRLVKTPKIYFLDTGLAAFLAGFQSEKDLKTSGLLGAFFETHVLGQIIRWHLNQALRPNLYFYRDHDGNEVDFVLAYGEKLKLMECKWTETPKREIRGFKEAKRVFKTENILSQTIITSTRGSRQTKEQDFTIADSIELTFLESKR